MNAGRRSVRFPGTDMDVPREFSPVDEWCRPMVDDPVQPDLELVVRMVMVFVVGFGAPFLAVCVALGMTW